MKRLAAMIVACVCLGAAQATAAEPSQEGLERWKFLIGDWSLVEKRYDFDSKLIQTNSGHAHFSYAMNGARIQELQSLSHEADTVEALHLFVYDPGSKEVEIARTDSGHFGFWLIGGTISDDRLDLQEKHPDPESSVARRITYLKKDADHFLRQLEFSTDHGETWFVRSEWEYARR